MVLNRHALATIVSAALLGCCAAPRPPVAPGSSASILASSSPAAGETVPETVDTLRLQFNPPARLDELTVSGAAGTMPMMVHAIGEVRDYSIPLSGLSAGVYTVDWRATAAGHEHRGQFSFKIRA